MKKRILVIIISLFLLMLTGCRIVVPYYNHKADDAISRAIYKKVGAKELYYQEKEVLTETNRICYTYYLNQEKEGVAEAAIEAANKVIEQENMDSRIEIIFEGDMPGGSEVVFIIGNFSDYNSTCAQYETLQRLTICGTRVGSQKSIYNDPATYRNFPNIKCLRVSEKIQKVADEAGIDWYEYWPDLEKVEVYSSGN